MAVPTSVPLSKSSTFATVPSLSAALAVTLMVAGTTKSVLLAGELIETVGAALTRTLTAVEVVTAPALSVALAV